MMMNCKILFRLRFIVLTQKKYNLHFPCLGGTKIRTFAAEIIAPMCILGKNHRFLPYF